jgi:hypothetical protein
VTQLVRVTLLIGLLALSLAVATAQDVAQQPVATEEVPAVQPTSAPPAVAPTQPLPPTQEVPQAVQPTQALPPTVQPTVPVVNDALPILLSARSDLELLANDRGGTARPVGWSGSVDVNDPQLVILIRLDLELLTGQLLGPNTRPTGWFGAVPSTPFAIARDIRHDLELLADTTIQPGVRPPGWTGDDPLMRCSRATQALVNVLERGGVFVLNVDPNLPDFCTQTEIEASRFAEANLLSNPVVPGGASNTSGSVPPPAGSVLVNNSFTVAFLDLDARQRIGVIPNGESFTPVARSTSEFSNMMLVRGNGFEVYVDYATTQVTTEQFEALPTVDTIPVTPACTAAWCG